MEKTCVRCGWVGILATRSWCRSCKQIYDREYYARTVDTRRLQTKAKKKRLRSRNRTLISEYLTQHPCIQCSESDPIVLQFHHLRDKSENISNMVQHQWSWNRILEEIEKCDVLCANCHIRITAKEQGWYSN